ncbi:MAG: prepilin-type N-terminal cleavage/methylation domain-containing protein [Patescibacteria group bacterium]|nr:prepilin-type N-terminal cleavage/methylation domain-containing protein [Patescibacteria group bacterium]
MKNKKGFTLIELLVVIAIIGLLSTLAVVALQSARQKSRDAKRVSDIKQVQTALDMYFSDGNKYPEQTATLGVAPATILCSTGGFVGTCASPATKYMERVPADPSTNSYIYTGAALGASYALTFTLEGATGGLPAGAHTATPGGIQ